MLIHDKGCTRRGDTCTCGEVQAAIELLKLADAEMEALPARRHKAREDLLALRGLVQRLHERQGLLARAVQLVGRTWADDSGDRAMTLLATEISTCKRELAKVRAEDNALRAHTVQIDAALAGWEGLRRDLRALLRAGDDGAAKCPRGDSEAEGAGEVEGASHG